MGGTVGITEPVTKKQLEEFDMAFGSRAKIVRTPSPNKFSLAPGSISLQSN